MVEQRTEKENVLIPKQYSSKVFAKDSEPYLLAEALITRVSQRRGTYNRYLKTEAGREMLLQNNAYTFDLLLRRDKKDINEVLEVLAWSQEDDFWKNNILSAIKFRLQYERLLSIMRANGIGSLASDPNAELTKQLIDTYRLIIHNGDFNPTPIQHTKFIQASKIAIEFFMKWDLANENAWPGHILRCLQKNFVEKGELVYPGHFCSQFVWEVLMPQYLGEIGLL